MGNSINIGKYLGRKLAGITAPTSSIDPDAEAFITAANITDATQQTAIIQLVTDLKNYNLWNKAYAIYPFVGGTATTHMYNLKDPQNTNAAFRLSFIGGWTHSATGALPNGTNAIADTFFNPVTQGLAYNNNHLGYYSRTQVATATSFYDMGSGNLANGGTAIFSRRSTDVAAYDAGTTSANRLQFANTDGRGFFLGSSINTNVGIYQKNGVTQVTKNPLTASVMQSFNFFLGGFNEANTVTYYSNKECAFGTIGDGLTSAEAANFYTAVQAFQTTLGRQV